MQRSLPQTPGEWIDEIEMAYADAAETKAVGTATGRQIVDSDLFQLAPLVCMNFRGFNYGDERLRDRVVTGTLTNYLANTDPDAPLADLLKSEPKLAFALCYVTAHLVLDLLDENRAGEILSDYGEHLGVD